jgi:hypothetical protein
MVMRRMLIISGLFAIVIAITGVSLAVGGAKADPKPTENSGSGGLTHGKLGF